VNTHNPSGRSRITVFALFLGKAASLQSQKEILTYISRMFSQQQLRTHHNIIKMFTQRFDI
jgi:hypothetical protein